MSLQTVLNSINLQGYSNNQESFIYGAITSVYNGSQSGKEMFENYANQGKILSIGNVGTAPQALVSEGVIGLPLSYFSGNPGYIDKFGNAVADSITSALVHEAVHAILGLDDNWFSSPNYSGQTVDKSNQIYSELGIAEQISYTGYGFDGQVFQIGKNYTQGNSIDTAVYRAEGQSEADTPLDASILDLSNDLVIGNSSSEQIIGGGGRDYLYGQDGNDRIGSDIIIYDSNTVAGFQFEDDGFSDYMDGGEGWDQYGVAGYFTPYDQNPLLDDLQKNGVFNRDLIDRYDHIDDSDGRGEIWTNIGRSLETWNPGSNMSEFIVGMANKTFQLSETFADGTKKYIETVQNPGTVNDAFRYSAFLYEDDGKTNLFIGQGTFFNARPEFVIDNFNNGDFNLILI